MTNFIPVFPLSIVVYPGENLNLHIFEPKFKQLTTDCIRDKKSFGIPSVLNKKMQEYGTMVEIIEVSKTYDDGSIDIKTKGLKVFRILEVIREIPEKLYCGAIVNYPGNHEKASPASLKKLLNSIEELHSLLNVSKDFTSNDNGVIAYEVAHHIGLSLEEEYDLLMLLDERQRVEYLQRHLLKVMPMLASMEELKEKIKLNGHFKNLQGFDI